MKVTEVLALEVADQPGGMERILDLVDRAGLNIEYMYAFTEKRVDKGALVFRFADPDAALRVLQNEGINIISPVKLLNRA